MGGAVYAPLVQKSNYRGTAMNKTRLVLISCGMAWLAAVGFGFNAVFRHEFSPGIAAASAGQWPGGSRIPLDTGRATLIMLAHPKCPCTRASIGELALLMAQAREKVSAYVLFLKPKDVEAGWEKTDLWQSAAAIPGVRVMSDNEGREARRFGAATSGQTLLFDSGGKLLFSGGITASRAHSGDNIGRSAIVSLLLTGESEHRSSSVFGCSIRDPE